MKMNKLEVSPEDFAFATGQAFFDADTIERIHVLSSAEHNNVDNASVPFWATQVQDVLEQKAVTYSERDIEEQDFLGLRIISEADVIRVSLGHVGSNESLVQVVFQKDTHPENGVQIGKVEQICWTFTEAVA